jgi:hypothetical protein
MSATPAAPYLTEFDTGGGRSVLAMVGRRDRISKEEAARIAEAHASGAESGKAAALATMEAKLEEQRALSAQQLEAEREVWAAREGQKLAAQLTAGLNALEAQIGDAAARVLAPFLDAQVSRRAVAQLRSELEVLLTKDARLSLSIAGPEDLLQALREELADKACSVTYAASDACDVRISADQTLLETRLAAWKAGIEEAAR